MPNGNDIKSRDLPFTIEKTNSPPINITDFSAKLISDSFDVNQAIRLYLNYENTSQMSINAIQLRFVLYDNNNNIVKSFLGSDNNLVLPNQTGSQKWQFQGMINSCSKLQVKLLKVKFDDGRIWQSNLDWIKYIYIVV